MRLVEATAEEILGNKGLYDEMVRIMTATDGVAPKGSCCGKNKPQHVKKFIENKDKYIDTMEKIQKRLIEPKWRGILYVAKAGRHYNSKTITDEVSRELIANGYLNPVEKYFAISYPLMQEIEKEVKAKNAKALEEAAKKAEEAEAEVKEEVEVAEAKPEVVEAPVEEPVKKETKTRKKRNKK